MLYRRGREEAHAQIRMRGSLSPLKCKTRCLPSKIPRPLMGEKWRESLPLLQPPTANSGCLLWPGTGLPLLTVAFPGAA